MKLTGRSDDEPLSEAWAYVSAEEAFVLYRALNLYFADGSSDPGRHHHLGGGDGGPELTIAIGK
jgi:hypothetical protein